MGGNGGEEGAREGIRRETQGAGRQRGAEGGRRDRRRRGRGGWRAWRGRGGGRLCNDDGDPKGVGGRARRRGPRHGRGRMATLGRGAPRGRATSSGDRQGGGVAGGIARGELAGAAGRKRAGGRFMGAFGLGLPVPPGAGAVLVASCISHSRAVIPSVSPQPSSMQSFRRSSMLACSIPPPFTRMCRSLFASSTRRQSSTPPAPVILFNDRTHEPSAALAYSLTPAAPPPSHSLAPAVPPPSRPPFNFIARSSLPPAAPCLTLASVYFSRFLQPPTSP